MVVVVATNFNVSSRQGLSFKAFHLSPSLAYPCLTLA